MSKRNTAYAGIDTGKNYLDAALYKHKEEVRVGNTLKAAVRFQPGCANIA